MGFSFRFIRLVALLGLAVTGLAAPVAAADLTVEITGHQASGGKVRAALFNDGASFPRTPFKIAEAATSPEVVMLVFRDLPAGVYAVNAYHDENGNSKLDRGLFNVPTERYGLSRDARGDGGPPQFRDAQFELREPSVKIAIKLH